MSSARYFANGVDFYRVAYSEGWPDGPYTSFLSANLQLKRETKVRQRETYWKSGVYVDYQNRESGKVQKLMPVPRDCDFEKDPCISAVCFGGHPYELRWMDVES